MTLIYRLAVLIIQTFFLLCITIISLNTVHAAESPTTPEVPQYQLFETSFEIESTPRLAFHSDEIKVDATIRTVEGTLITVPCFYDGKDVWKMRFTPTSPGRYHYQIDAVTSSGSEEVTSGNFIVIPESDSGFARIGPKTNRHFVFDDGSSYFPLGENLGWVSNPSVHRWIDYLDECQEAGINWIRIWMCPWGFTELEWTRRSGRYHGLGQYDLTNARMIDGIFKAAEEREIYIQWVINHHGQYSTDHNPIWDQNPYNVANGGFLRFPGEFFTNEEMKSHYRDRLRYLVARWGYSTHLFAWEFWNEVDLTSDYKFDRVKAWHEEMSEYLRSIDPYNHLQTTSASSSHDDMHRIENLDFLQSHAYVNNLIERIFDSSKHVFNRHPNKPHFFGELSFDWRGPNTGDTEGVILHNQLWASVHSQDSGTAMTWWWDNWVRPYNLYHHFKSIEDYIKGIHWDNEYLVPLETNIEDKVENRSDLVFIPPLNWSRTQTSEFTFQRNGEVKNGGQCDQFVQGQYHPELAPNPTFNLQTDVPTQFGMEIGEVARAGAQCVILLNGERVVERDFPPAQSDTQLGDEGKLSIDVPAGQNQIAIRNTGKDWFRVKLYWVENFSQRPAAYARGNKNRVLVWIHDTPHQFAVLNRYAGASPTVPTRLTLPEIKTGEFKIEQYDPYTQERTPLPSRQATKEGLTFTLPSFKRDIAFQLKRKTAIIDEAIQ